MIYKETTGTTGTVTVAAVANPTMMDSILCAIQSDTAATGIDKLIVALIHGFAGAVFMNKRHTGALFNFGSGQ